MTRIEFLRGRKIKEGDTFPNLRLKLFDGDDPFNLSGYTAEITIKRSDADSAKVDSEALTIENATRGIVEYSWNSGDTDTSGTYLFEIVVDDGSGSTGTFPSNEYARLYIEDRL